MKEIILNWRMYVLAILSIMFLICMVSEPTNNRNWILVFCLSRIVGIVFGYAAYKLAMYWEKRNQLPDIFKEA